MAHNPILHAMTKHKEIDLLFIREKVIGKELTIVHILGDDQWAVLLTKSISTSMILQVRSKLDVSDSAPISAQPSWACWGCASGYEKYK